MNKLLFTLSLVVLVAVSTSRADHSLTILQDQQTEQYAEEVKKFALAIMKRECANKPEYEQFMKKISKSLENNKKCLTDLIKKTRKEIENDIQLLTVDNLKIVFQKFCHIRNEMLDCIENVYHLMRPCLNKIGNEKLDIYLNIITRLSEFACKDNGARIIRIFFEDEQKKCVQLYLPNVQKCADDDNFANIVEIMFNNIGDIQQCQNTTNLKKCFLSEMEQCVNIELNSLVNDTFNIILTETKCIKETIKPTTLTTTTITSLTTTATNCASSKTFMITGFVYVITILIPKIVSF